MGRRTWAQYRTYLRAGRPSYDGLLIRHILFVESSRCSKLRDDIAELSDAVHAAFLADVDTVYDAGQHQTTSREGQEGGA